MNKLFICVMSLMVSFQVSGMEPQNGPCTWDEVEKPRIDENAKQLVHVLMERVGFPVEHIFSPDEIRVVRVRYNILCEKHAPETPFGASKFFDEKGKEVYCGNGYHLNPNVPSRQAFVLGLYKLIPGHEVKSDFTLPAGTCTIS
jgi:hypothetical protein